MSGKYKVILIEEGLGNLGTCFFYTREAIEYAVENEVFEGKKAFADHPSKFEEATRPERSVRDVVGHYENCEVVDGEDGQAILQADLVTIPGANYDWARSMIEAALAYSGKFDSQLIGLSINASGNSEKKDIDSVISDETLPLSVKPKLLLAKSEGATDVEYCTELQEAVSVDMVTEAGARGRFVKMIESERAKMATKAAKESDMEKKKQADEAAAKQAKQAADDAAAAGKKDGADGSDAAGDDAETMKTMLKKYVGGDDHSDEQVEAMKQALAMAKEGGMEGEEAEACAGNHMKMSALMAAKQKKEKEAADAGASDPDKKAEADMEKKESNQKLLDRIAMLEKEAQANKVKETISKTIKESGFEGKVETAFLELLGKPMSESEVLKVAKTFKEGLKIASETSGFYNPEKSVTGGDEGFSLANCVKGDN